MRREEEWAAVVPGMAGAHVRFFPRKANSCLECQARVDGRETSFTFVVRRNGMVLVGTALSRLAMDLALQSFLLKW